MHAPQHAALDYGRHSQAGAQGNDGGVVTAPPRPGAPFTDQGHARVIVNSQWQIKRLLRPRAQVERASVAELAKMVQNAGLRGINDARIRNAQAPALIPLDALSGAEFFEGVGDGIEPRRQRLVCLRREHRPGENGAFVDQPKLDAPPAKIHRQRRHGWRRRLPAAAARRAGRGPE